MFIGAKMVSPGYITDKSPEFNSLCDFVGFQRRTVLKHLDHLVRLQWVGYDLEAKRYYIRSWAWFRSQEVFYERASIPFMESDMATFREFVAGAVIGAWLKKQAYYFKKLENELDPHLVKVRKRTGKPRLGKASMFVTYIGSV